MLLLRVAPSRSLAVTEIGALASSALFVPEQGLLVVLLQVAPAQPTLHLYQCPSAPEGTLLRKVPNRVPSMPSPPADAGPIRLVDCSPDGSRLLLASGSPLEDSRVLLLDLSAPQAASSSASPPLWEALPEGAGALTVAAWRPDRQNHAAHATTTRVAVGTDLGAVLVLSQSTESPSPVAISLLTSSFARGVSSSPVCQALWLHGLLVTRSADDVCRVWGRTSCGGEGLGSSIGGSGSNSIGSAELPEEHCCLNVLEHEGSLLGGMCPLPCPPQQRGGRAAWCVLTVEQHSGAVNCWDCVSGERLWRGSLPREGQLALEGVSWQACLPEGATTWDALQLVGHSLQGEGQHRFRVLGVPANLPRLSLELPGHAGSIVFLFLSRDCRLLVSASADGTVRVWDVAGEQGQRRCVSYFSSGPEPVRFASCLLSPGTALPYLLVLNGRRVVDLASGLSLHLPLHVPGATAVTCSCSCSCFWACRVVGQQDQHQEQSLLLLGCADGRVLLKRVSLQGRKTGRPQEVGEEEKEGEDEYYSLTSMSSTSSLSSSSSSLLGPSPPSLTSPPTPSALLESGSPAVPRVLRQAWGDHLEDISSRVSACSSGVRSLQCVPLVGRRVAVVAWCEGGIVSAGCLTSGSGGGGDGDDGEGPAVWWDKERGVSPQVVRAGTWRGDTLVVCILDLMGRVQLLWQRWGEEGGAHQGVQRAHVQVAGGAPPDWVPEGLELDTEHDLLLCWGRGTTGPVVVTFPLPLGELRLQEKESSAEMEVRTLSLLASSSPWSLLEPVRCVVLPADTPLSPQQQQQQHYQQQQQQQQQRRPAVVAVGGSFGDVRVVETRPGHGLLPISPHAHLGRIVCAKLSRRATMAASAGWDRVVSLWNLRGGVHRRWHRLGGHQGRITSLSFAELVAPGQQHVPRWPSTESTAGSTSLLATGSSDQSVRLWQVPDPPPPLQAAAASATARRGRVSCVAVLRGMEGGVSCLAFSSSPVAPSGGEEAPVPLLLAAAECYSSAIRVWRLTRPAGQEEEEEEEETAAEPSGWLHCVLGSGGGDAYSDFSAVKSLCFVDPCTLASGHSDRSIRLWDTRQPSTPVRVLQHPMGHHSWVSCLCAPAATAGSLLSGGHDDAVLRWELDPLQVREVGTHRGEVTALACSGDGRWAASGSSDETVAVWDLLRGRQHKLLQVGSAAVACVDVSQDGHLLLSGGEDRLLRVWDRHSGRVTHLLHRFDPGEVHTILQDHLTTMARLLVVRGGPEVAQVPSDALL